MTKYPRHIHFHQNIVDNLRLSGAVTREFVEDDDVAYWMFDLWATSSDYQDESLIKEWKETALLEIRMTLDMLARNNNIDRADIKKLNLLALQKWEARYYGEVKTHE